MFRDAPKSEAKITSRNNPRMRLLRIAMPTMPVARVLTRLFSTTGIYLSPPFGTKNRW